MSADRAYLTFVPRLADRLARAEGPLRRCQHTAAKRDVGEAENRHGQDRGEKEPVLTNGDAGGKLIGHQRYYTFYGGLGEGKSLAFAQRIPIVIRSLYLYNNCSNEWVSWEKKSQRTARRTFRFAQELGAGSCQVLLSRLQKKPHVSGAFFVAVVRK